MIPQKTVQEIIETAKIDDVIQDYISLKRRGVNMIGLCPFHNEKTPSFTVSPTKNIFKCFGCGMAGDSAKFLMEHESVSYPEALRFLAKKYGIEVQETQVTPEMRAEQQLEDSLYIINEYAKQYFVNTLFNTDIGKSVGLNYFKERGYREETIKKFGLGFTLETPDAFTQKAIKAGYNIELLKKLGLASQYGKDFFRNRVMFTIHNLSGKIIAFAGRIMVKNVKAPKYINSPETDIYHKSKILYGAYFAKKSIRQNDECILVEGYTDVISLHQAGIENVVASSGTSLTEGQIGLIKRFTPNIKILYDGDAAGIKAALRGLDMVLEQDMNVKVVLLPEGEDPDSYLQKVGTNSFNEYINKESKDFILFKTDLLISEVGNDPVKRAGLVKDIVMSIAKIPDPLKRSVYLKECSRLMEMDEQVLTTETNKFVSLLIRKKKQEWERKQRQERRGQPKPSDDPGFPSEYPITGGGISAPDYETPSEPSKVKKTSDEFKEKDIARILISGGSELFDKDEGISIAEFLLSNIEEILDDFDNEIYGKIVKECLSLLVNKQQISSQYFISHPNNEISQTAIDLLHTPFEFSPGWERREIFLNTQKAPELNFTEDSRSALLRFKLNKVKKVWKKNQERLKDLKSDDDFTKITKILKVQKKLSTMIEELAKELGTVVL
ncbi:MAG: DNA primase [Bacteroidetes bacterium]|jgi:DNA primase|nr:DNA primase [Bacteroidota bacterium]MDF1864348.1 DNA primase [Saprospiraceae bacterium]